MGFQGGRSGENKLKSELLNISAYDTRTLAPREWWLRCIGSAMKAGLCYSIFSEYKFTVVVLVLSWNTSKRFMVVTKCLVNITIAQVINGRRSRRSQGHVTVSRIWYSAVAVFVHVIFVVTVGSCSVNWLCAPKRSELTRVIKAAHVAELVDRSLNIGQNGLNEHFTVPLHAVIWCCVRHGIGKLVFHL